uniref:Uncharacterized protein n=1 Tax=Anopheles merus TaxID=30066 RepID=A0A182VP66_ANOME
MLPRRRRIASLHSTGGHFEVPFFEIQSEDLQPRAKYHQNSTGSVLRGPFQGRHSSADGAGTEDDAAGVRTAVGGVPFDQQY